MSKQNLTRIILAILLILLSSGGVWLYLKWQVEPLPTGYLEPTLPFIQSDRSVSIPYPDSTFLTTIATFHDELFAYLMYQHFRSTTPFNNNRLLLTYQERDGMTRYQVRLILGNDYVRAVDQVAALYTNGTIQSPEWKLVPNSVLRYYENQSRLFNAAYNLPVKRKLEELPPSELRKLVQSFIRYKSTIDPRIRKRIEPIPQPLTPGEANQFAGDIIAVAEFYNLPLEIFLGVGAMENNYMNIRGDLEHSIWKRRAAKDDIILERRRGRVRVLNYSSGPWQITRETLRYVHRLYLKDSRNYEDLPEHLRPPKDLKLDEVNPEVLTTYAGLLLRNLLDHFDGDVSLAVGAYNGGQRNPNMHYEQGVRTAAEHARRVLEQAAVLNGDSVMGITWLTPQ